MNKKILTMVVLMAISANCVWATVPENQDAKMYSPMVRELTQTAVSGNLADNIAAKKIISMNLKKATQQAVFNNFKVKAAEHAYGDAKAKLDKAYAGHNPKFSYGYSFSRSGSKNEIKVADQKMMVGETPSNTAGHQVSVSMPIYTGGLISGGIKAAKCGVEISNAQLMQTKNEAKVAGAKAYFMDLRANNMKEVAEQAVSDLAIHYKNVKLQYQVGVVAKSDVLATEVAVANANTNLIKAKNGVELAEAGLNYALSLPSNTKITIEDKHFDERAYGITLQEATAYALTHSPLVVQSVLAEEIMKAQVDMAHAGFKPKIQVSANKSWGHSMSENLPAGATGRNESWSAAISASWDLWDGGSNAKSVKSAEESLAAQKVKTKDAIEAITLQVRKAYLTMHEAEATIKSTKVAVDKAEENFRIASLRYKAGVGINLDVLDAELNLNKARNEYVDALYNYNVSVAELEQAIGVPADEAIGVGLTQIHRQTAKMSMVVE